MAYGSGMRRARAIFLLSLLPVLPWTARGSATDGIVEMQTPTGPAYLSVLIRHEPRRLLAYALITRKLPAAPIAYADLRFELLDDTGHPMTLTQVPTDPTLVETPDPRGTTANALYLVTPVAGHDPSSARMTWQGRTVEAPTLKTWDD